MNKVDEMTRRQFLGVSALACLSGPARSEGLLEATPSGQPWQIGCYTRPWDRYDYRVALDAIAEAGFPYVGIMTHKGKTWVMITPQTTHEEAEQIGEEVKQRGLKAISVYGEFSVRDAIEPGIEELRRLIEHTVACGSPNLLLGGTTDPKRYAPYYKVVAECCDFAAEQGVGLSIKPHGGQNATGRSVARPSNGSAIPASDSGTIPAISSTTRKGSVIPWTTRPPWTGWSWA